MGNYELLPVRDVQAVAPSIVFSAGDGLGLFYHSWVI